MGAARKACCAGGIKPMFIAVLWRDNTVGGHKDGAVEGFKFLLLLPPGIAVVAFKMCIFLEGRVVVGRKHFRVGIHIHPGAFCLLQKHFQIPQVMAGNQNTGVCSNADINGCDFRISVRFRIGLI